jgi:cytochrome P450
VELLIGSGNHDPEAFADPDSLDLCRSGVRQLGFGLGIHFCLGAPLARLEVSVALTSLFRRAPGLRLAGDIVRRPQAHMRGLDRLPVRLA